MTIAILTYLPAAFFILGLACFVMARRHEKSSGYYVAFSLLLASYLILQFFTVSFGGGDMSLASLRAGAATTNFIAYFVLLFCLTYTRYKIRLWQEWLLVLPPLFFVAVGFTDVIIKDVHVAKGSFSTDTGVLYEVQAVFLASYLVLALVALVSSLKRLRGAERSIVQLFLLALFVPIIMNTLTNTVFLQSAQLQFLGPLSLSVFVVAVGYAIIRHRLFDIKLAAVRTVAYALSIVLLASIYYFLAYVVSVTLFQGEVSSSVSLSPVNIIIALILAFVFQPIKKFFDKVTDKFFYRDNYESEDFFASLGLLLSSTVELRGLVERASERIAATFKAEQAFFLLNYTNGTSHHLSAGTHGHGKMPLHDARLLDEYVKGRVGIFLTDLVKDAHVRRMLVSHKVALVMPLFNGERVMGYVLLGYRKSGNYTQRDLSVLSTVSNELVIAIQNALSLHEVRELNATLQQRIDMATKELRASNAQLKHLDEVKDEFMSMASHQLRTPLTSVKGYLSMVLDGDAGKISAQQQKLLSEAFNSSERMVRLIADFLNVSRLQTGKFVVDKTDIDFRRVIEEEVGNLRVMAGARDLKVDLSIPKDSVTLHADATKLREVAMNFIDNAIYYSKPNTTIRVELLHHADSVEFLVHDTGIGVPKEEQSRLFHKFYRASNARKQRPDGTGVGLYLAKKVITAHGGAVVFHSVENRGSTFGFRIPLQTAKKRD